MDMYEEKRKILDNVARYLDESCDYVMSLDPKYNHSFNKIVRKVRDGGEYD